MTTVHDLRFEREAERTVSQITTLQNVQNFI